ncbi:MAG: DUF3347 domain-containing protein [Candidatus Cloacimonetes bacterium]|nr:DUF3347 domain-containing protein [Candidatus Cloacimonadota bacterium]MCF7813147.1 DUF3347 domain-containing protein [Candidatus Cloacimonadota bacterium]MCF7867595.1 DUF3347 domain-containing protein [Candidatus Cloacimonadota bacterium]MCF7883130.1 DUF3347 domain-containing protein [Candidatus Cloacimonadota bacterium]
MEKILILVSALVLIFLLGADEMFDSKMNEIAEKYLYIQEMLSLDRTDEITQKAAEIADLAKDLDVSNVPEEHKMHFANLPEKIGINAQKISKAETIDGMRAAFKELSKPMAMWASMMQPMGMNVAFCSMAPGSWLQRGDEIMNPYYGDKMLHCGEIVSEGKEMESESENKMHHGMEHK